MLLWGYWNLIWPNTKEKHTLEFSKVRFVWTNCYKYESWLALMASRFSIKILSLISVFGFDTEKKYDEKNACVQRGNSNCGNINFVKSESRYLKMSKYQNIKIAHNSCIKWGRWTWVVPYWFEKIMDVSNFVFYYQFEIVCRSWYCSANQNFFFWLKTQILKTSWSAQIFARKLMKLMQKGKCFRNKVYSPKELFQWIQNSIRKWKTNHILIKPSSRF